jgi:hypothetical protein
VIPGNPVLPFSYITTSRQLHSSLHNLLGRPARLPTYAAGTTPEHSSLQIILSSTRTTTTTTLPVALERTRRQQCTCYKEIPKKVSTACVSQHFPQHIKHQSPGGTKSSTTSLQHTKACLLYYMAMLFARPFGLITAFLLIINITSQIGSAVARPPSSSEQAFHAKALHAVTHVKGSTRKTGSYLSTHKALKSAAPHPSSLNTKSASSKTTHSKFKTIHSTFKTIHSTFKTTHSTSEAPYTSLMNVDVTVPTNTPSYDDGSRKRSLRQAVNVTPKDKVNSVNLYGNVNEAPNQGGSVSDASPKTGKEASIKLDGEENKGIKRQSRTKSVPGTNHQNTAAVFLRLCTSGSKSVRITVSVTGTVSPCLEMEPSSAPFAKVMIIVYLYSGPYSCA